MNAAPEMISVNRIHPWLLPKRASLDEAQASLDPHRHAWSPPNQISENCTCGFNLWLESFPRFDSFSDQLDRRPLEHGWCDGVVGGGDGRVEGRRRQLGRCCHVGRRTAVANGRS